MLACLFFLAGPPPHIHHHQTSPEDAEYQQQQHLQHTPACSRQVSVQASTKRPRDPGSNKVTSGHSGRSCHSLVTLSGSPSMPRSNLEPPILSYYSCVMARAFVTMEHVLIYWGLLYSSPAMVQRKHCYPSNTHNTYIQSLPFSLSPSSFLCCDAWYPQTHSLTHIHPELLRTSYSVFLSFVRSLFHYFSLFMRPSGDFLPFFSSFSEQHAMLELWAE